MAHAATAAPKKEERKKIKISLGSTTEEVFENSKEHFALVQEFDPYKKYMFELAVQNIERELPIMLIRGQRQTPMPHQKFPPFRNLTMSSQVIWNGQRRILRYYDGCDTIFVDKQPQDKDIIKAFIDQTRARNFLEGKFGAYGDEKMLLMYMGICSWNSESEFRTRTANEVFVASNSDRKISSTISKLDLIEEALKIAREATDLKMGIHADYLNVPDEDYDSGNKLTEKERRALYRERASKDPQKFIDSYGDPTIEIKYYIGKSLDTKDINNKNNPNRASWASGTEICDISGLRSRDAILDRIFEFSQTEEGSDFLLQLKALFN